MNIKLNLTNSLFFLLILLASQASIASWQLLNISEADINSITEIFPEFINDTNNLSAADKVIKYLYNTKKYEKISIKEGGVIYALPLRKLKHYKISGLNKIDLKSFSENLELTTPISLTDKVHNRIKTNSLNLLNTMGYSHSIVSIVPNSDLLEIIINPGLKNVIGSISIQSDNFRLNNKLEKSVKSFIKRPLNDDNINAIKSSTNSFLQDNRYLDSEIKISVDYSQSKINIFVSNPYYYRIALKSQSSINIVEIKNFIWKKKYSINRNIPAQIDTNIVNYYQSLGFPFTKVISQKSRVKDFIKYHYLAIEEGPRTALGKLNIIGSYSKSESYYKKMITKNSSKVFNDGFYVESDLENSLRNMISTLNNSGYLFAKIQFLKTYFNKEKDKVDIEISLREGQVTTISDFKFSGLLSFKEAEIARAIKIKRGDILNLNNISQYLNSISQFYTSRGFLDFKGLNTSDNLLNYSVDGTEASFNFLYDEGKIAKFGSLILTGNEKSKRYVVRKSLTLTKGEVITRSKIALARKNLNALSIFSNINIKLAPDIRDDGLRDLIVNVTERKPGLFRAGLGAEWQDDSDDKITTTLKGYTGASYSNLSGKARAVAGQIEIRSNIDQSKLFQHKASLGATEPFVFGSRTKGRLNLVRSVDEQGFEEATGISNVEASNKVSLSLERQLDKNLNLLWTLWSLDSVSRYNQKGNGSPKNEDKVRIVEIGPLFQLDHRDNKFIPTRGYYTRWDTTYAPDALGASNGLQFVKTEFNHTFYYTPRKLLNTTLFTWANSIRSGYIKNLGRLDVPSTRVFRLHGQSKIRGFGGTNGAEQIPSSIQVPNDANGIPSDQVSTESYFHMLKSEIRFPLKFMDPFSLAFFYDIGQLVVNDPDKKALFKNPDYRDSFGIGLHLNTPVGPVVLEVAKKIKPLPDEKEYRFHFSIGSF